MAYNKFLHENKVGLCSVALVFGIPLAIISLISLFYGEGDTGIFLWAHDLFNVWSFWLLIIGAVLVSFGGYYLYVFIKQLREFRELIKIESKAKFIKNIDRIEELAWKLHPKYERIVIERKNRFKIK